MTDITDAEAAEVLWASSEQGKAAVEAAWEKARRLGAGRRPGHSLGGDDFAAIVYAAYLAAGWGAEIKRLKVDRAYYRAELGLASDAEDLETIRGFGGLK